MKEKSVCLPEPQAFDPKSQCLGKFPHETFQRAHKECQRLAGENPDKNFTVYKCPYCKKYHVGKVKKGEPERDDENV